MKLLKLFRIIHINSQQYVGHLQFLAFLASHMSL